MKQEADAATGLLSCPFCGMIPNIERDDEHLVAFHTNDMCILSNMAITVNAWNTRYEAARPAPSDECEHPLSNREGISPVDRSERCNLCGWTTSDPIRSKPAPADVREAVEIAKDVVTGIRTQVQELHYTNDEKRAWRLKIAALNTLIAAVSAGDGWHEINVEDVCERFPSGGMLRTLNVAVAKFYGPPQRVGAVLKLFPKEEVDALMLNALQRQQARIVEGLVDVIKRYDLTRLEPHLRELFSDPREIIKQRP